jgi:hypothetical protein
MSVFDIDNRAVLSAAFLNETFDQGFPRLYESLQRVDFDRLIEDLACIARTQYFIDGDEGLYASRQNRLASAWLLVIEENQPLTRGR